MSDKFRKMLRLALVAIGVACIGFYGLKITERIQAGDVYDNAADIAFGTTDILTDIYEEDEHVLPPEALTAESLADIDISSLKEVNGDVTGWIVIPGTRINYPLVQGSDNSYYLNHTWDKKSNIVGAIYIDCRDKQDMSDFNTLIYGHNMYDETMFSQLRKYSSKQMWQNSPTVYIVTEKEVLQYQIFSAYTASTTGFTYNRNITGDTAKSDYLNNAKKSSCVSSDVSLDVTDNIITLSTCTSMTDTKNRWVVHAKLVKE